MKRITLVFLTVIFGISGFAKENKVSQSQAIMVELRDPAGDVEERMIRVKELESGKITQLTLEKDPSTPQVWNGYFIIQFFTGDTSTKTLDFVKPTGESFSASISQEKAVQKVVLFNTPEELALYEVGIAEEKHKQAEKQLAKQIQVAKPKGTGTPINQEKMNQLLRQQGQLQETTQLSMEEAQTKKRMALLELQQKMSEDQKRKKKAEALAIVVKADSLFSKNNFKEAEILYSQATELDPESEAYYYRYGISLFKVGNYNKSLATFSLADVDPDTAAEKDYYMGLNYLKLKDNEKALKKFIEVRDENIPAVSPGAAFYAANIQIQQQKFADARKSAEFVLDNSKDPKLDRQAEELLEQIDKLENYYESKKEKYRLSAFTGLIYDSNVLNTAENNVSTDVKAWRLNYGVSALAILHRTMTSDLAAKLAFSDYYSVDSKLQNDATLQATDVMDVGITIPYHQELTISKKAMSLEVVPGYKNISMSSTTGSREVVTRTAEMSTTLSAPIKPDLLMSGKLDLGSDQSLLSTSVGDDDASATRYGLTVSPIQLLDMKGEKILIGEFAFLTNNANGKNLKYTKYGLAATYTFPTYYKGNGSLRADYAIQDYAEASTPRKDTNISLTSVYSKDLSKQWNMALTAQATTANSDVETYKYNKFLVSGLFTYTTSILQK
jgi:Tfp pilus assembly protein PilF